MAIGSGFIETVSPKSDQLTEHCLKQLSVLCRHEMLHYLLAHMFRMEKHLTDKGLMNKIMSIAESNAIQEMDNIAADWELSARGYDEDDKEVVRHMTLAGRVIGGLILEDSHPE